MWACVADAPVPAECGGRGGGGYVAAACFVYDEAARRFLYWGPNPQLRLVSAH